MITLEIINFLAVFFYFYLAIIVFHRSPRQRRNQWGALLLLTFALSSTCRYLLYRQTAGIEYLKVYMIFGILSLVLSAPVSTGFVMYYTGFIKRLTLGAIAATIIIFLIIVIALFLIYDNSSDFRLFWYGWFFKNNVRPIYAIGKVTYVFFAIQSLRLLWRFSKTAKIKQNRLNAFRLFRASLITYILGAVTDVCLPVVTNGFIPPTAHIISLIWAITLYRLILKADLLSDPDILYSKIPNSMIVIDANLNIIAYNETALKTFKIKKDDLNINILDLIQCDTCDHTSFRQFISDSKTENIQCTLETLTPENKNFRIHKSNAINSSAIFDSTILTLFDIHIYFEEISELQNMNQNMEFLLKEIHHRIKNSLQMVISLINITDLTKPDSRSILVSRVNAIQQVHETIYKIGTVENIDIKNYLESLIDYLAGTYDIEGKVRINIDIQRIKIPVKTATTLGILINETICNSFKYAFNDKQDGEITVSLKNREDNCQLLISDNGNGPKAPPDSDNLSSVGKKIIEAMILQLNGKMQFSDINGYEYDIEFRT